jgi:vesicle-fusing ATPase
MKSGLQELWNVATLLLIFWSLLCITQGRKLLIIGTTSRRDVLQEMEMLSQFSAVLHVSNLNNADHMRAALTDLKAFDDDTQLNRLAQKLEGQK